MTPQEYIISTLRDLSQPLVKENIGSTSLEDAIYAKLMSKKFRKVKADDTVVEIAKKAIALSVKNKQPIALNAVFGGNKLWRFEEAPEIDWAELFSMVYFARWLKSIASVYEHGAYLEYYSEDIVLLGMNNIPREDSDRYTDGFRSLIAWIEHYLPKGVSFTYRRYSEDYSDETEYLAELEEAKKQVSNELNGKLPVLSEAQKAATEMNVILKPGQDQDPQWREKVEFIHQSIERTTTIERYFNDPKYIPICPTYFPGCLAPGSTKKSYAKFWVGVGALERKEDKYNELVLTPNQLENTKYTWEDVKIEGLEGKNFKRVRVVTTI